MRAVGLSDAVAVPHAMNQNQAHSVKSPRTLLKIYGERNTGTNYLRQLININIDADLLSGVAPQRIKSIQRFVPGREFVKDVYFFLTFSKNLGWKHSLVRPVEQLERISLCSENLAFVTLTKNPYSWLLSLYKRPYPFHIHQTNKPDLESFLETKWPTLLREQGPRSYANPIKMWNQKNAAYLKLRERFPTFNATYEALLAEPEKTVAEMVDELGHRSRAPVCFIGPRSYPR